ncbi:hypothetical protein ADUPG1_013540 [Aduncisulcus paluster]|uniref:Uncharacterized protein n=1 Tax=Aduncisulcus paluster TaxID=2918883 RepID=A0ABQ5K3A8_9EUKA|nr:hypothetical protein ADUPG1_013540 [Aduncisulcus paluster]
MEELKHRLSPLIKKQKEGKVDVFSACDNLFHLSLIVSPFIQEKAPEKSKCLGFLIPIIINTIETADKDELECLSHHGLFDLSLLICQILFSNKLKPANEFSKKVSKMPVYKETLEAAIPSKYSFLYESEIKKKFFRTYSLTTDVDSLSAYESLVSKTSSTGEDYSGIMTPNTALANAFDDAAIATPFSESELSESSKRRHSETDEEEFLPRKSLSTVQREYDLKMKQISSSSGPSAMSGSRKVHFEPTVERYVTFSDSMPSCQPTLTRTHLRSSQSISTGILTGQQWKSVWQRCEGWSLQLIRNKIEAQVKKEVDEEKKRLGDSEEGDKVSIPDLISTIRRKVYFEESQKEIYKGRIKIDPEKFSILFYNVLDDGEEEEEDGFGKDEEDFGDEEEDEEEKQREKEMIDEAIKMFERKPLPFEPYDIRVKGRHGLFTKEEDLKIDDNLMKFCVEAEFEPDSMVLPQTISVDFNAFSHIDEENDRIEGRYHSHHGDVSESYQ